MVGGQPNEIDCGAQTQLEPPALPILVVTDSSFLANPFGCYLTEILRSEGLVEFQHADLPLLSAEPDPAGYLAAFDVVLLAETSPTAAEEQFFRDYVAAGGNLIAMRPDPNLADLFGLSFVGLRPEQLLQYFAVDTTDAPGAGIVDVSMQYHGAADDYSLAGAVELAELYADISTPSGNPAVTLPRASCSHARAIPTGRTARATASGATGPAMTCSDGPLGRSTFRPRDCRFRRPMRHSVSWRTSS
jgi:hypothetical protein